MRSLWTYIMIGVCALMAACVSSEEDEQERHVVLMPVILQIPAEDGMGQTRAMGDPGDYERFALPTKLYLYLIATKKDGDQTLLTIEGNTLTQTLDKSLWVKTINTSSGRPTPGDSVYRYTGNVTIEIPDDIDRTKEARAYAVVAGIDLKTTSGSTTYNAHLENPTDKTTEGIQNLRFDVVSRSGYTYLRDIYSTPYNLGRDGTAVSATNPYYGTVQNFASNVPVVNLMLYHVAAKIDVTWNVPEDKQTNVRVKNMELFHLFNKDYGQAYLFKPTDNTTDQPVGDALPNGYTHTLCTEGDVGQQWYGRGYTYAIACKSAAGNYFVPLRINKETDGSGNVTDQGFRPVVSVAPESTIFAPWIRVNLTLNSIGSGWKTDL